MLIPKLLPESRFASGQRRFSLSLLLVIFICGLFLTSFNSSVAYAASLPAQQKCKDGEEFSNGFCYTQQCKSGYTGVGPVCWQDCNAGLTDAGAFCTDTTSKDTYTRVVGVIPDISSACPSGYPDQQAGLCYPAPKSGYTCTATMCTSDCPAGYTNFGLTCSKTDTQIKTKYDRGVGKPLNITSSCPSGYPDQQAGLCYPAPQSGYSCTGALCSQDCPAGYTNFGLTCTKSDTITKKSYIREAGSIPNLSSSCPSGYPDQQAGLCYQQPRSGYSCAGVVCAESGCRSGYTDFGLTCTNKSLPFDTYSKGSYTRPVGKALVTTSSCPANKSDEQAGLCYTPPQSGYSCAGVVCTQNCPAGYTDFGLTCTASNTITKKSYSRGVGKALDITSSCPSGYPDQQAGLCYPAPQNGYTCSATVCTAPCPAGYTDAGLTCSKSDTITKAKYDRGIGKPLDISSKCPADKPDMEAGLCYTKPQTGYSCVGVICSKNCPAGYTDFGLTCTQSQAKSSYTRDVGYPATDICLTDGTGVLNEGRKFNTKYNNQLSKFTDTTAFSLVFASDAQMPWWMEGRDPDCNTDECVLAKSKAVNAQLVKAVNNAVNTTWYANSNAGKGLWPSSTNMSKPGRILPPLALVMNGDLTSYFHFNEVDLYRQYYETGYKLSDIQIEALNVLGYSGYIKPANDPTLQLPIFTGLGNHDYENNLGTDMTGDCSDITLDKTHCAKQAVNYIKNMVYCGSVKNFINPLVDRFDEASLAYSWDIGEFHFVQLNNRPNYEASAIGIAPSIPWLKTDLQKATAAGQKIVLNMHDFEQSQDFSDAIKGNNVVALFAGHIHQQAGQIGTMDNTDTNGASYSFPTFLSGSADYQTFLLVQFTHSYMNVGVVSSKSGKPVFVFDVDELEPAKDPKKPRHIIALPATYKFPF